MADAMTPIASLLPQLNLEGQINAARYVLDSQTINCTVVEQMADASATVNLTIDDTSMNFAALVKLPQGAQVDAAVGNLSFVVEKVQYGDQPGQWYAPAPEPTA